MLIDIKDDARNHHQDNPIGDGVKNIENSLDNIESNLASIWNTVSDVDMALHGDYGHEDPSRKKLNCLMNAEDHLREIEIYLRSQG